MSEQEQQAASEGIVGQSASTGGLDGEVYLGPSVAQCSCCGLQWEENCEQHTCIILFGECISCRFSPSGLGTKSGTQAELDAIQAKRRQMLGLPPNV